jgi:hypothetical protein
MWGSWVKKKGTTQVMYIAKLKDGPKRIFEVEVFFSFQNIDFHFLFEETLEAFLFFHALSFENSGGF